MEIRFGKKLLAELTGSELIGPVDVVTRKQWESVYEGSLSAVVRATHQALSLSRADLETLAGKAQGAKTILAVGDGLDLAAARWAAWQNGARIVLVPTVISGESVVTSRVIHQERGLESEVGEKIADLMLVDFTLIWGQLEDLTRAGVGDLLAISTAVQDLRIGEPKEFSEDRAGQVMELVDELFDWADDIYDLTESGIRKLVELLLKREELARTYGARRWIEGSEKIFSAAAARILGREFPPGPMKCLAVVLITELQGMNSRPLRQFLSWIRAPYQPEEIGLTDLEISEILSALPEFAREHGFPRTMIEAVEMTDEFIKKTILGLCDPLIKNSFQKRTD